MTAVILAFVMGLLTACSPLVEQADLEEAYVRVETPAAKFKRLNETETERNISRGKAKYMFQDKYGGRSAFYLLDANTPSMNTVLSFTYNGAEDTKDDSPISFYAYQALCFASDEAGLGEQEAEGTAAGYGGRSSAHDTKNYEDRVTERIDATIDGKTVSLPYGTCGFRINKEENTAVAIPYEEFIRCTGQETVFKEDGPEAVSAYGSDDTYTYQLASRYMSTVFMWFDTSSGHYKVLYSVKEEYNPLTKSLAFDSNAISGDNSAVYARDIPDYIVRNFTSANGYAALSFYYRGIVRLFDTHGTRLFEPLDLNPPLNEITESLKREVHFPGSAVGGAQYIDEEGNIHYEEGYVIEEERDGIFYPHMSLIDCVVDENYMVRLSVLTEFTDDITAEKDIEESELEERESDQQQWVITLSLMDLVETQADFELFMRDPEQYHQQNPEAKYFLSDNESLESQIREFMSYDGEYVDDLGDIPGQEEILKEIPDNFNLFYLNNFRDQLHIFKDGNYRKSTDFVGNGLYPKDLTVEDPPKGMEKSPSVTYNGVKVYKVLLGSQNENFSVSNVAGHVCSTANVRAVTRTVYVKTSDGEGDSEEDEDGGSGDGGEGGEEGGGGDGPTYEPVVQTCYFNENVELHIFEYSTETHSTAFTYSVARSLLNYIPIYGGSAYYTLFNNEEQKKINATHAILVMHPELGNWQAFTSQDPHDVWVMKDAYSFCWNSVVMTQQSDGVQMNLLNRPDWYNLVVNPEKGINTYGILFDYNRFFVSNEALNINADGKEITSLDMDLRTRILSGDSGERKDFKVADSLVDSHCQYGFSLQVENGHPFLYVAGIVNGVCKFPIDRPEYGCQIIPYPMYAFARNERDFTSRAVDHFWGLGIMCSDYVYGEPDLPCFKFYDINIDDEQWRLQGMITQLNRKPDIFEGVTSEEAMRGKWDEVRGILALGSNTSRMDDYEDFLFSLDRRRLDAAKEFLKLMYPDAGKPDFWNEFSHTADHSDVPTATDVSLNEAHLDELAAEVLKDLGNAKYMSEYEYYIAAKRPELILQGEVKEVVDETFAGRDAEVEPFETQDVADENGDITIADDSTLPGTEASAESARMDSVDDQVSAMRQTITWLKTGSHMTDRQWVHKMNNIAYNIRIPKDLSAFYLREAVLAYADMAQDGVDTDMESLVRSFRTEADVENALTVAHYGERLPEGDEALNRAVREVNERLKKEYEAEYGDGTWRTSMNRIFEYLRKAGYVK